MNIHGQMALPFANGPGMRGPEIATATISVPYWRIDGSNGYAR